MTPTDPIISRDGTRLACVTQGDPARPPILLIHGWAQHLSCWQDTMARLSDRFYVVAFDMRGHGGSDKPAETAAYTDTALWGDDVAAVIRALDLDRPILAGWSYGARVIAAYLATHGNSAVSGVALVGGILAIGKARTDWMVGDSSPALNRDLYSDDLLRLLPATRQFVEDCTIEPLGRAALAELVGANMLCPGHVRRALFATDLDFQDVFASMTCPGLVIHGAADRVVSPATGEAAARLMQDGTHLAYDGVGHAPFIEAPDRFARDLAGFAQRCRTMADSPHSALTSSFSAQSQATT